MSKNRTNGINNKPRPTPTALGINVEKPKFPQYAVSSKRLESFETWEEYIPVKKTDLVEAGLVYTGVADSVRCYFCGGGLKNWEQGDIPMEEHAKWYPNCPHILLVKGKDYIDKLRRGEKTDEDGPVNKTNTSSLTSTNYLDSAAAQSCLQMGFTESMVEKSIAIYMKTNGKDDFKGKDLCEILFALEDDPNLSVAAEYQKEDNKNETDNCITNEEIEPLDSLLEENQRLKENRMCKICLDKKSDVLFLPCGHMVCCPQCAPALVKCPVCRKQINGHVKTFFAVTSAKIN